MNKGSYVYKKTLTYLVFIFCSIGIACPPWRTEVETNSCNDMSSDAAEKNCLREIFSAEILKLQDNERNSTPDSYEPSDTTVDAICLDEQKKSTNVTLHSTEDVDYFTFTITKIDTVYWLNYSLGFVSFAVARLYDMDGTTVLKEKSKGSSNPIGYTFSSTGTYFFSLSESDRPTSHYLEITGGPLGSCP